MRNAYWKQGIAALFALVFQASAQTNYYVATNGPHTSPFDAWDRAASNIHDVIALARNGDQINVSNGTFVVTNDLVFDYAVTVRGEYGSDQTILTGAFPDYTNRCFDVRHDGARLEGLTISNFYCNGNGGGVWLRRGNMTDCFITHNQTMGTARWGGGVYMDATWSGLVVNCHIRYNANTNQFGGGMAMAGAGVVRNSEIYGNYGHNVGGVFFNKGMIERCVIRDNICGGAGNGGGGIGGSANVGPGVVIRDSLIMRNTATNSGWGGGIQKSSNSFSVINCTIVSNYANWGGGLRMINDTHPDRQVVINCVIYSNASSSAAYADILLSSATPQTNWFFNCCAGAYVLPAYQGNITNYPMFVNPDPANPNYRFQRYSPCVNAGTNHIWVGAGDLDGRRRIDRFSGMVDMGCYEYIQNGTLFYMQ